MFRDRRRARRAVDSRRKRHRRETVGPPRSRTT
jgi:hypothetical protein